MSGFGKRGGAGGVPLGRLAMAAGSAAGSAPGAALASGPADDVAQAGGPKPPPLRSLKLATLAPKNDIKGLIVSIAAVVALAGGGALLVSFVTTSGEPKTAPATTVQATETSVAGHPGLKAVFDAMKRDDPTSYGELVGRTSFALNRGDTLRAQKIAYAMIARRIADGRAFIAHADSSELTAFAGSLADVIEAAHESLPALCGGEKLDLLNPAIWSDERFADATGVFFGAALDAVASGKAAPTRAYDAPTREDVTAVGQGMMSLGLSRQDIADYRNPRGIANLPPVRRCELAAKAVRGMLRSPEPGHSRTIALSVARQFGR